MFRNSHFFPFCCSVKNRPFNQPFLKYNLRCFRTNRLNEVDLFLSVENYFTEKNDPPVGKTKKNRGECLSGVIRPII